MPAWGSSTEVDFTFAYFIVITLCAYAQQGYASVCVYVYIYVNKKQAV